MSKRQKWIDQKIRTLVGEGKSNKQAVAMALAMAANKKFVEGGVTDTGEEKETPEITAYKRKVVGILGDEYDEGKVTGLVDRMSSLSDEENDPQLMKLSRLDDESVRSLAAMVDSASTTFKRGDDESKLAFIASFAPSTWVSDAGSRRESLDNMIQEVKDVKDATGLTIDELIDLAEDIIMTSKKTPEEKEELFEKVAGQLRSKLR